MARCSDRMWPAAFANVARTIRPHETPQNKMALSPEVMRGSWLATQLENGGFGNNIEIRSCTTHTTAPDLDNLVNNMMLAEGMFFPGYSEEEVERAKPLLRGELQQVRSFKRANGRVGIGMKAWLGIGWKQGDEQETPC